MNTTLRPAARDANILRRANFPLRPRPARLCLGPPGNKTGAYWSRLLTRGAGGMSRKPGALGKNLGKKNKRQRLRRSGSCGLTNRNVVTPTPARCHCDDSRLCQERGARAQGESIS